jgi:hypothetical protein
VPVVDSEGTELSKTQTMQEPALTF